MQSDDSACHYSERRPGPKSNLPSFDGSELKEIKDFELKKKELIHKAFELEINSGASVFISIKSQSGDISYYSTDCSILEQVKQTPLISNDSYQYSRHCFAPDLVKSSKCLLEQGTVVNENPVNIFETTDSTRPRIIPLLKNHHRKSNGKLEKVLKHLSSTSAKDSTITSNFIMQSSEPSVLEPKTCLEDQTVSKLNKTIPEKLQGETLKQHSADCSVSKTQTSSHITGVVVTDNRNTKEDNQKFSVAGTTDLSVQSSVQKGKENILIVNTVEKLPAKTGSAKSKQQNLTIKPNTKTPQTKQNDKGSGVILLTSNNKPLSSVNSNSTTNSCRETNPIFSKPPNITWMSDLLVVPENCRNVSRKRKPSTEIGNVAKHQHLQVVSNAAQPISEQNTKNLHTTKPTSHSTPSISLENSSPHSTTCPIFSRQMNVIATTDSIVKSVAPKKAGNSQEVMMTSKPLTEVCNNSKQLVSLPYQNTAQLIVKQTSGGLDVIAPTSKLSPEASPENDHESTQSCKATNRLSSKNLKTTCTMVSVDYKSTNEQGEKDCQNHRKQKPSQENDNVVKQSDLPVTANAVQQKNKEKTEDLHVTTSDSKITRNLSFENSQITSKQNTTLCKQLHKSGNTDCPLKSALQNKEDNCQKINRKRKLSTEKPIRDTNPLETKQNTVGLHSSSSTSKTTLDSTPESESRVVHSSGKIQSCKQINNVGMTYLTVGSLPAKPSTTQLKTNSSTTDLHAGTSKKGLEQLVKRVLLPKEINDATIQIKNSSSKMVTCPPKNSALITPKNPNSTIATEAMDYQLQQPASHIQMKEQISKEKPFILPSVAKAKLLPCPFGHNKLDPIKEFPLKCIENSMKLPSIPSSLSTTFGLNSLVSMKDTSIDCMPTSLQSLCDSSNLLNLFCCNTLESFKETTEQSTPSNTLPDNCFVPYDWEYLKPQNNISLFDQLKMKNTSAKTLLTNKTDISGIKSKQYIAEDKISCSTHVKEKTKLTSEKKQQKCVKSSASKSKCNTVKDFTTIPAPAVKNSKQKKALKFWQKPLPKLSIPNKVMQNWKKEIESKLSPAWLKFDMQLQKNVAKWSKKTIGLIDFLNNMKCMSVVWSDICNRTGTWNNTQRARLVAEALSTSKIISISRDRRMSIQKRSPVVQQNILTTSK